jgi:hypothetical protein
VPPDRADGDCRREAPNETRQSANKPWKPISAAEPAVVRKAGLGWGYSVLDLKKREEPEKVEGDKRTPAGFFRIGASFGFAPSRRERDSLSGSARARAPTRFEYVGALAAIIFTTAVVIGTAFPALLRMFHVCSPHVADSSATSCPSATSNSRFTWNCYPMLTGIGYIASKTRAKMRTLQALGFSYPRATSLRLGPVDIPP